MFGFDDMLKESSEVRVTISLKNSKQEQVPAELPRHALRWFLASLWRLLLLKPACGQPAAGISYQLHARRDPASHPRDPQGALRLLGVYIRGFSITLPPGGNVMTHTPRDALIWSITPRDALIWSILYFCVL